MTKLKLIKSAEQTTSKWSGGTTTELFIFPEGADYGKRDFDFRISSALVECEESEFTPLPGVYRYLMILDGELKLEHKGHGSAVLKKFEQDEFFGDWTTVSRGKVRDFNLMCRNGFRGELMAHVFSGSRDFAVDESLDYRAFYMHQGMAALAVGAKNYLMENGDFLFVGDAGNSLSVSAKETIHLIEVKIKSKS